MRKRSFTAMFNYVALDGSVIISKNRRKSNVIDTTVSISWSISKHLILSHKIGYESKWHERSRPNCVIHIFEHKQNHNSSVATDGSVFTYQENVIFWISFRWWPTPKLPCEVYKNTKGTCVMHLNEKKTWYILNVFVAMRSFAVSTPNSHCFFGFFIWKPHNIFRCCCFVALLQISNRVQWLCEWIQIYD